MRITAFLCAAALVGAGALGKAEARGGRGGSGSLVSVRGYTTSRGTYVAPHYRTSADGIASNNLSYRESAAGYGLSGSVEPAAPRAQGAVPPQPPCPDGKAVGSGVGFCLVN